jgi:hypothetical protein
MSVNHKRMVTAARQPYPYQDSPLIALIITRGPTRSSSLPTKCLKERTDYVTAVSITYE